MWKKNLGSEASSASCSVTSVLTSGFPSLAQMWGFGVGSMAKITPLPARSGLGHFSLFIKTYVILTTLSALRKNLSLQLTKFFISLCHRRTQVGDPLGAVWPDPQLGAQPGLAPGMVTSVKFVLL